MRSSHALPSKSKGEFKWGKIWLLLVFVVAAGLLFIWAQARHFEHLMHKDLLQQAKLFTRALNYHRLNELGHTERDRNTAIYFRIKEQLILTHQVFPHYQSLYLLGQGANGRVFIMADSEPYDEGDSAVPVQVFIEAPDEVLQSFSTGQPIILDQKNATQERRISAFVPLVDPRSGQVITILGLDMVYRHWRAQLSRNLFITIAFTVAFILIVLGSAVLLHKRASTPIHARNRFLFRYCDALIVLIVGTACTMLLSAVIHEREQRSRQETFSSLALVNASLMMDTFRDLRDHQLEGLARFFEGSVYVDRQEFNTYAGYLANIPSVQAWEWVPVVATQERLRIEEMARREGVGDYLIWEVDSEGKKMPAFDRETYYPVFYTEPLEGNISSLGHDLGSDPIRYQSLENAKKSGLITSTKPVDLVHDSGTSRGILVVRPIFSSESMVTQEGFVLAVLDLNDVFTRTSMLSGIEQNAVIHYLFQLQNNKTPYFLASTNPENPESTESFLFPLVDEPLTFAAPMFAFGEVFLFISRPGPVFSTLYPMREGWLTILGGLLISALLSILVAFINNHRQVLEQTVQSRTNELRVSKEHLTATLHSIGDGVITTNAEGRVTGLNTVAEELTGWTTEEAQAFSISEVFHIVNEKTGAICENPVTLVLEEGKVKNLAHNTVLISRDGMRHPIADSSAPIRSPDGKLLGVVLVFRDQSDERIIHKRLQAMHASIESSIDAIMLSNLDGTLTYLNPAGIRFLEYSNKEQILGRHIADFWDERSTVLQALEEVKNGGTFSGELSRRRQDGAYFSVAFNLNLVKNSEGSPIYVMGSFADITQRKKSEEHIRYLSFHDPLTGLYNRVYLEEEMNRLDTERQLPLGIIMADVNGLKLVNDAYGHRTGDRLLKIAAEVLKNACRKEDIIARWGGDEFVVFLPRTSLQEVENICRRITIECTRVKTDSVPLSIALGTAEKAMIKEDISQLFREAENRMYQTKLAESRSARSAVLSALRETLREKSHETEEHAERIIDMARIMGKTLNLSSADLDRLTLLASLHDIGKITISEEILGKTGPLTALEWVEVRKHPETGYRIARSTDELAHVAEEILSHHERWDGTGYPRGISGDDIPLLSRISSIVDAYDAMINPRPYRHASSKKEALEELKRCAGTQFEPALVNVFVNLVEEGLIDKENDTVKP